MSVTETPASENWKNAQIPTKRRFSAANHPWEQERRRRCQRDLRGYRVAAIVMILRLNKRTEISQPVAV